MFSFYFVQSLSFCFDFFNFFVFILRTQGGRGLAWLIIITSFMISINKMLVNFLTICINCDIYFLVDTEF